MPSESRSRYRPLSGTHETSVAIVGGGMTGALVAQAFAAAGVSVTIVEAGLVARGSTVASSALLLHEPDLELSQLERRYGPGASRRVWRLSQESVGQLVGLLTRLRIHCKLEKRDSVYFAIDEGAVLRLKRPVQGPPSGRIRSRMAEHG